MINMYQPRDEYDKKLKRIEELRKKYPKMNDAERVGHLVELIFAAEGYEWLCEAHFKELDDILSKL